MSRTKWRNAKKWAENYIVDSLEELQSNEFDKCQELIQDLREEKGNPFAGLTKKERRHLILMKSNYILVKKQAEHNKQCEKLIK